MEQPTPATTEELQRVLAESTVGLVQRESGLVVPEAVADQPDVTAANGHEPTAYDPDGRRRIVIDGGDRKALDRALRILAGRGLGMIVGCRDDMARADGKKACGQPLRFERVPSDPGPGCQCSRVHWA